MPCFKSVCGTICSPDLVNTTRRFVFVFSHFLNSLRSSISEIRDLPFLAPVGMNAWKSNIICYSSCVSSGYICDNELVCIWYVHPELIWFCTLVQYLLSCIQCTRCTHFGYICHVWMHYHIVYSQWQKKMFVCLFFLFLLITWSEVVKHYISLTTLSGKLLSTDFPNHFSRVLVSLNIPSILHHNKKIDCNYPTFQDNRPD